MTVLKQKNSNGQWEEIQLSANDPRLGKLSDLTTNKKISMVDAVNEVNAKLESKPSVYKQPDTPSATPGDLWFDTSVESVEDDTVYDTLVNEINNLDAIKANKEEVDAVKTYVDSTQVYKLTEDTGFPFNVANQSSFKVDEMTTPGDYYVNSVNLPPDFRGSGSTYLLSVRKMFNNLTTFQFLYPYQPRSYDDKHILFRNIKNTTGTWTPWRALETVKYSIYLEQELQNLYQKVCDLQTDTTKSFGFITDTHYVKDSSSFYGMNGRQTIYNMARFSEYGLVDMWIHGGDLINGETEPAMYKQELYDMFQAFNSIKGAKAILKGNHDYGAKYNDKQEHPTLDNELTQLEWYTRFVKPFQKDFVVDPLNPTGGYFYKDYDDVKLRVIFLNTADLPRLSNPDGTPKYNGIIYHGIQERQLKWFGTVALDFSGKSNPSEWAVLTFSHVPMYKRSDVQDSDLRNGYVIARIIKAFKNGTTYSPSPTTGQDLPHDLGTFDFTGKAGRHIAHISGHYHRDANYIWDDVRYIQTLAGAAVEVPSGKTEDPRPRTEGTVLENSWAIFTVDTAARKLYVSRFGQGDEYEISY